MKLNLQLQYVCGKAGMPSKSDFTRWARAALAGADDQGTAEIGIRIVDEPESAELNQRYRRKAGATNVLSFAYDAPGRHDLHGDLAICAPVVEREAREQDKAPLAHWAHMSVHGILHLRGYDHITRGEAGVMEGLETTILEGLGFPNPYG